MLWFGIRMRISHHHSQTRLHYATVQKTYCKVTRQATIYIQTWVLQNLNYLPPLLAALGSAPCSRSFATHWALFHLQAECRGCHPSSVSADILAPCLSKNCTPHMGFFTTCNSFFGLSIKSHCQAAWLHDMHAVLFVNNTDMSGKRIFKLQDLRNLKLRKVQVLFQLSTKFHLQQLKIWPFVGMVC